MKRGINFTLPICIGYPMDEIEKVEFLFRQNERVLEMAYPSDKADMVDGCINLHWTQEDTYTFVPGTVKMDTRITLIGTDDQPETPIISLYLKPTLFEQVVVDDGEG